MEPSLGEHSVEPEQGSGPCAPPEVYALVAYINGELGDFLYALRQEIVPTCRLRSHVSLLPPRKLAGKPEGAAEQIAAVAGSRPVFEVRLGEICVFPVTNVIYLDVAAGREELTAMHAELNGGALAYAEPFAYHPHITLGQELTPEQFAAGLALCRRRWAEYAGSRSFPVETISFVKNTGNCGWRDLNETAMLREPAGMPGAR